MRYSVIIPIYNAERTLHRCLDSIVPQLRDDVEVLLINDGSTDGSETICLEYKSNYSQMHYFRKENGGVSSARNLGLEKATGEYIAFVDSDDYIGNNCFAAFERLTANQSDFVQFSYCTFGGDRKEKRIINSQGMLDGKEMAVVLAKNFYSRSLYGPCAKLFKKEIIDSNRLSFNENIRIGEDLTFVFSYILHVHSMEASSDIVCFYGVNSDDSLSRRRRDYLEEELMAGYRDMTFALDTAALSAEHYKIMRSVLSWIFYRNAYSCFKELLKYDFSAAERRQKIKGICSRFNVEQVKPQSVKCWAIALPVRMRMIRVIDDFIMQSAR